MNLQTNIGREFLNLVSKHFPKNHRYNKIFNKNNIKVSYSCTDNLQTLIKKHNRKILETSKTPSTENNCNCRKKDDCPLKNNCLASSVVYNANVTTESDTTGKNYIGLTEGTFKQRYTQHKLSFRNWNYSNSTELSKQLMYVYISYIYIYIYIFIYLFIVGGKRQINYKFIPASLFRGCPLIRGFNENNLYHRLYTI